MRSSSAVEPMHRLASLLCYHFWLERWHFRITFLVGFKFLALWTLAYRYKYAELFVVECCRVSFGLGCVGFCRRFRTSSIMQKCSSRYENIRNHQLSSPWFSCKIWVILNRDYHVLMVLWNLCPFQINFFHVRRFQQRKFSHLRHPRRGLLSSGKKAQYVRCKTTILSRKVSQNYCGRIVFLLV